MESFEEMWVSAATNSWSNAYSIVVAIGVVVIFVLQCQKKVFKRRALISAVVLAFSLFAIEASGLAIREKWRIRHDWGKVHQDQLTEKQRQALITDGANLVFGPIVFGAQAFAILLSLGVGIPFLARSIRAGFVSEQHARSVSGQGQT